MERTSSAADAEWDPATDAPGPMQAPPDAAADPRNFSVILGGPLFQLLRRAHMAGDALQLIKRRVLVIAAFAWLPLLLLAAAQVTRSAEPSRCLSSKTSRSTSGSSSHCPC
jgi:hypothetical protein